MCYRILVTIIAYLALMLEGRSQKSDASMQPRVILEDIDVSGQVSRDGKWLSHVDWNTGNLNIREISTGKNLKITNGPGDLTEYAGFSVFSPQGDRIGFSWNGDNIRVASLKDSSIQIITSGAALYDWSSDGKKLLIYKLKEKQLGYVHISSGEFKSILSIQDRILNARVSPDGKFVAFATLSTNPAFYEIQIVSTLNGNQRTFVAGDGSHYAPVWSKDGNNIFYISDRGNKPQVWRKALNDNNPQSGGRAIAELPNALALMLGIDSAGTVYLGAEDRGGTDVYIGTIDWNKYSVNDVNKVPTPPFRGARRAVFAPLGDRLAFMQKARGYIVHPGWQTPVVRELASGASQSYPTHLTLRDEPLWSVDGKVLYFVAPPDRSIGEEADQVWSFYRLDLEKASYTQFGKAASAGLVRMAGATSNSIVYFLNTLGKNNIASIFSLDISSGSSTTLYRTENNQIHDAALSPNGSRLAIAMNEADGSKGLYILERGQIQASPIVTVRPNARAQLMWLSSEDAIITSGRVNGKQGIWRIPVDGSLPQALNLPASKITEVRLSSDGRRIAFTQTNQLPNQILELDGNKK